MNVVVKDDKNMPIIKDLKTLGISEKEAKVYLAALELGPSSILNISKKARVKRTTIYEMLEELKNKKLITETIKGDKRLFMAVEPAELEAKIKNQERIIQKIMPELKGISNLGEYKPKIRYYEGFMEIRGAYDDTLKSQPDEILSLGSVSSIAELLGWEWGRYYINERIERQIPVKVITNYYPGVERLKTKDEKELRQTKILPKNKQFSTDIEIYGDKMLIISFKTEIAAVLIESKAIGESMRMFFEFVWDFLVDKVD